MKMGVVLLAHILKFIPATIFFFVYSIRISAQDTTRLKTIEWNISYTADAGRNFQGGCKAGNTYMGLLIGGIRLHTDKFWKGGKLQFEAMNTHGNMLSGDYIGDIQIVSNIENGNFTFIESLFYRQDIFNFSVLIGLQDLNAQFCAGDYSCSLTNSSFGIHSTFSLNFGIPIYPKTSFAISALYSIKPGITLKSSFSDGEAGSLENDPNNLSWSISPGDGILSLEEIEFTSGIEKHTNLKLGGFYHTGIFTDTRDDSTDIKGNYGFYVVCDKQIYSKGSRDIGTFAQVAVFPSDANFNKLYLGAGLSLAGIIKKYPDNRLVAGFAYTRLFNDTFECDLECNYCFHLNSYFSLQPAFHYIIHPGANQELTNALAGFIRISLSL